MTRRHLLLFGLLAVTVLGVGGWLLWPRPTAITQANAHRIQHGMTRQEVEAILGRPTKEIRNGELPLLMMPDDGPWDNQYEWNCPEFIILVAFEDGRVCTLESGAHVRETILERVRRWLHL